MIITAKKIRKQLQSEFTFDYITNFDKLMFSDETYFIPAKLWYEKQLIPYYIKDLKNKGLFKYKKSYDCDKFTNAFKTAAQQCHAKTSPIETEGIAIATIHYTTRTGGSHAIAAVLVDDNDMAFIDPQPPWPQFVDLTFDEKKSIRFMKF